MDVEEFRKRGKEMIDYAADYLENVRNRKPLSQVKPGYLMDLLPDEAPKEGEKWDDIVADIDRAIMPGITHWHSPHFHAYFPTGNSYPSICADILSDALGCIGFSWITGPACTELEMLMMKWLGKMIKLPVEFYEGEEGGGVIQGTASEATLICLLAARSKTLQEISRDDIDHKKMVIYCSDQAHSSVERAAMFALVKCRKIQTDEKYRMDAKLLHDAIIEDRNNGFVPFFCVATLGTTSLCSFDNLEEIGPVCNKERIWLHIDAAYAGSAFICPEFRYLMDGVQHADSFNFNPHKWLKVNFDCSALWFRNSTYMVDTFNVDPIYLRHRISDKVPDYRHWQIPLGRRFRSLKMWFVFRSFGIKGLQDKIRNDISLAKEFEKLVRSNENFEVVNEVILSVVCFRLKPKNEANKLLLDKLVEDGRIYLIPSQIGECYFLRFTICSSCTEEDVIYAWNVILEVAEPIIKSNI